MARTRKQALYVAGESTYGTDPSANGSGYVYVPAIGRLGLLKDEKQILETDLSTGRNFTTPPEVGADGWSFDFEVPLVGLAAAAGDGSSPGADDWLDILLEHIFQESTDVAGEGVGSSSTTTSLVMDTDITGVQQLIPVFESGIPTAGPRTQWAMVTVDGGTGTYTVRPTMSAAPTTAAVGYGTKTYQPSDAGGASCAFVHVQDDVSYTCLGGRCTAASITAEEGQIVKMKLTFSGDTKTQESKGSLPSVTAMAQPEIKALLSPVWFNDTQYATRMIEIDLGIKAAVQESTAAANGRANYESIMMEPKVTIEPLFADAIQTLKRTPTRGRLMVQLGGGVFANSMLNTLAAHAEQAQCTVADPKDENGRVRQMVTFQVTDPVEFSTGVSARVFQLVRA